MSRVDSIKMRIRSKVPRVGEKAFEKRELTLNKFGQSGVRVSEGHNKNRVLIGLGSRTNS
jgi:hypothetical protein